MDIKKYLKNSPKETETIEFKMNLYLNKDRSGFIKDIAALANAQLSDDKYIIMGVKESKSTYNVVGIDIKDIMDSSIYNNWIVDNIEPEIKLDFQLLKIDDFSVFVIQIISKFTNGPFIMKKDYLSDKNSFNKGDIYIRKGTSSHKMSKTDIDVVYSKKAIFKVKLVDKTLFVDSNGIAKLELAIINTHDKSWSFDACFLRIINPEGDVLYNGHMFEFETIEKKLSAKFYMDLHLPIKSKSQTHGIASFSFSSSDAVSTNLDIYGQSTFDLQFVLQFRDIDYTDFDFTFEECNIYAKPEILRKIRHKN